MGPAASISAMARATADPSATSSTRGVIRGDPSALSSSADKRRPTIVTSKPALANRRAMARPRPEPPPVTRMEP